MLNDFVYNFIPIPDTARDARDGCWRHETAFERVRRGGAARTAESGERPQLLRRRRMTEEQAQKMIDLLLDIKSILKDIRKKV